MCDDELCPTGTTDKGVVEVTNCFCVPHKEHADQVEAELNYAMDVYELNRRVNANESIVGMCLCFVCFKQLQLIAIDFVLVSKNFSWM